MHAKKHLGQNFLVDKNKINEITNLILDTNPEIILEVGPGKGALTKPLLENVNLTAVEIDKDMVDILNNEINNNSFNLIHKDFLDIDLNELFTDKNKIHFVSNLPYYVSSKIIFKVIYDNRFNFLSIMLQKELINRIVSKPNSKDYGRLSVAIQTFFEVKNKLNVSAGCFIPKPKVDSGFIILERKDIDIDISKYLSFIKKCFSNKRKTLINSLKNSNFKNIDKVKIFLTQNNIKENIRAENLDIKIFISLFNFTSWK